MENIALYVGNLLLQLFDYLGLDLFTKAVEWIGVVETGYALIFVILALIVLIFWTQRKGRR